ncbi:RagB/SusD family nutrient uptake outer membrane protein [Flavobacterium tyrosinilyticum]|uniref:RagB/SusD family nutrient uptake outer membrane protein n=1 Tax=Flavobacterium tyrosinilyticum TaxID=1658740 RepID=UPI002030123D|nr:RagB/SusD family nutrient uptake outer membrane protein [Flavobacterium tyrosinilyticum]MCM0668578.1 RagB/SusD family nutrient uptake outer membrane protein [Flavobacterium tyrosinilyticum]
MKKIIILSLSLLIFTSCESDFLDTTPESTINDEQLASSAEANEAIVNGIYSALRSYGLSINNHEDYGHKSILTATDLMSNDMLMTKSSWYSNFYNYQARQQTNNRSRLAWSTYYPQIKTTNVVLAGIPEEVTDDKLKAIRGQALALRGYFYFMLARMYGPTYIGNENKLCVPLYTEVVFEGKARSKVAEVYAQIQADLNESVELLQGFKRKNNNAVDQSVAQAFLADVYLEMGKYSEAAVLANTARQNYPLLTENEWMQGFYDVSNKDTMWGASITSAQSTFVASFFSHFDNTNESGYAGGLGIYKNIDKSLYDLIPNTDFRRNAFVSPIGNSTYPSLPAYANLKFIDPTIDAGDYIYLRAASMYYIEAEAYARSGNEALARKTLYDITVTRDPAYILSTNTGNDLINEIILQKRIELWGEGYAWFDMKRLGVALRRDYVGSNHTAFGKFNIPVGDNKFIFQIPQAEIDANPLIVQNPL